jgi:plastocyanin domain-containing protein
LIRTTSSNLVVWASRKMTMKKHNAKALTLLGAALLTTSLSDNLSARSKDRGVKNVTVIVDGSGYHPSSVKLKAGQPVHLTFISKGESCANSIRIPALKKQFSLKPGQKKQVVFTPKKGQAIAFACSMNMFKGTAVAR